MPHNHGIRVMIGNDDSAMRYVRATGRKRPRRAPNPNPFDGLVFDFNAEVNRLVADQRRRFQQVIDEAGATLCGVVNRVRGL